VRPKENPRNSDGLWTSREAYLLALVCLLSGLVMGYLFHGSSAPAPATVAAAQPAAAQNQAMPTASDLSPLAAPMLAALKIDPNNFEVLVQLGNLYYDHQVFSEAIDYYTRALAVRPNEVNVRTDLGTAFWYSGFPEKAVAEYEKSLKVDPNHVNSLFNMGVVRLEGLKDARGAIVAFEKLLALNPSPQQRSRAAEMLARARQQAAK
jgi:cytochrome c-type biogenesis protein CcmH/NrfG